MSFITTKFHEILLKLRWQTVLSTSIFNFGQISKFKKGVIPRENSCG